jgi:alpha-beta hydrolase superfamily lysophospholipase
MKESTFEGVGGLKIFTRSWQPEGKTRGVVVIVPGFNSHSDPARHRSVRELRRAVAV